MLAVGVPDEPRWVEAHGIAAAASSWRCELGECAIAVGNDTARLIVVCDGDASRVSPLALIDRVEAIAREYPQHSVLVTQEDLAHALDLPHHEVARVLLHTLPDPDALDAALEGALPLPADAPLDHLEPALAEEIARARLHDPVWCAYVDGLPVSFAYAPWLSPRWFDISVDTDRSARQLGLGTLVSTALIHDQRARGREPVWAADAGNAASLRLAARLGFVAMDELFVLAPAGR